MSTALLIIDVQNDFLEGAVLAARNTKTLIEPLNQFITAAMDSGYHFFFTRDWHPSNHCSFNSQGGPWPPHCIQGTFGAKFADGLIIPASSQMIDIETDPVRANMTYSAFENTSLLEDLKSKHITEVIATGIATEYCVASTVIDALRYGFPVTVIRDLVRPINLNPGDDNKALLDMSIAGAHVIDQSFRIF